MMLNSQILLPTPLSVLEKLVLLLGRFDFWVAVMFSMLRISVGFILAATLGSLFAVVSHKSRAFRQFISPVVIIAKSVPVASIIILILVWISSDNISVFISFIMVMPVVYTNVYSGIDNLDIQLDEMAQLFKMKNLTRIRYIVLPQIMPFFESACIGGLGMAFKSGIAAEVIGLPDMSIGENLYEAKVFLDIPTLFAWTVVIIIVSFLFEKLFAYLISLACKRLRKVTLS